MRRTLLIVFCVAFAAGSVPCRAAPEEGYFAGSDGVRLFYRKVGHGRSPLVLLHGGPGSNMNAVWPDLEPLAGDFSVLMYDQRGGGRSELVSDATRLRYTDHVQDLEALRIHFGLERMVLVGESWGAGLAALYALDHPQRVSRLLLLGPMSPSRTLIARRFAKTDEKIDFSKRLAEYREALPTAPDPVALCREIFGLYMTALFHDPTAISRRRGSSCDAPPEAVRNYIVVNDATLRSLGEYDFLPRLRDLRTPTLIVEGADSPTTLEGVRAWAEAMPEARLLLLADSGHFPQVERADLFFPAAERFLMGGWPKGAVAVRRADDK